MHGVENIITKTFEGKEIELEAYLKAENVQNAYILLIVGDENNQFSFDMSTPISGTTDWQKLTVKIPYTSEASKITIASNIEGSGTIWLDNFSLKIDNVDINELKAIDPNIVFNSKFVLNELSEKEINRLQLIGKLWGFLKYYHPEIAIGKYEWDDVLFQILPLIEQDDFNLKIEDWVTAIGSFEVQKEQSIFQDVKLSTDFQWFDNELISKNLKEVLRNIVNAKKPETHYYVNISEEVSNPIFENEKIYANINYDDDGIKLLALFRYWNYIEYFYPYKYLISSNWDAVLKAFIPKIIKVKNETEYALCLTELMGKTEDTHHTIFQNESLTNYFGKFKVPVSATFIDDNLIITNVYSNEKSLKEGDILLQVDNINTKDLKEKYFKYSIASNLPTTLREIAKKIIRTNKEKVDLRILREGKTLETTVSTISMFLKEENTEKIKEISSEIGYLNTEHIELKTYDSIFNKWQNKKAIIFDIRNYPKENFIRLLPYLHEKPINFFRITATNLQNPGIFSFQPKIEFETKDGYQFKGKIIVLVNSESQSKSEFNVLALQSYSNTIVIGSQTAGTDGDMSNVVLPGNILTGITGTGIYKIDKNETQQIGIKPDIEVYPTLEDIKNKKDVILETAIKKGLK